MGRGVLWLAAVQLACLETPPGTGAGDASAPICSEFTDWSDPVEVPELSSTYIASPALSGDGRLLVLESMDDDFFAEVREGETFVAAPDSLLAAVNSADEERNPTLSADGLTIWFTRGVRFNAYMYVSRRAGPEDDFPLAQPVSGLEALTVEGPDVRDEPLELFFSVAGDAQWELAHATCESFDSCTYLGTLHGLEADLDDMYPAIRRDGLEMFYNANSDNTLLAARRADSGDDFAVYDPLDFVGYDTELTSDGTTLYLNRGNTLNRAERECASP